MQTCELRVDNVVGVGMSSTVHARLYVDGAPGVAVVFRIDSLDLMLTDDGEDTDMLGWMTIEGSSRLAQETPFSGIDHPPNPTTVVPNLGLARELRRDSFGDSRAADLSPGTVLTVRHPLVTADPRVVVAVAQVCLSKP